jgi:hypothetical protein
MLRLMAGTAPQPSSKPLLSQYTTTRDRDGRLVLRAASNLGPVLGCLVPTVLVAVAGSLIAALGDIPLMFGPPVVALAFAVIAVPILAQRGTRAWVLAPGSIRQGTIVGARQWWARTSREVRSVVLKREVWVTPRGRIGSTDAVYVLTDRDSRLNIVSVYNWGGQESRLTSGGAGSLAHTGPTVPPAPAPVAMTADARLTSAVSEAVREITDLLASELGVPVSYECMETRQRPRR